MSFRAQPEEYAEYYAPYIAKVQAEGELTEILKQQGEETEAFFAGLSDKQTEFRYAPGKWSIREILGHLTDTERIFAYRMLRIAREDPTPLAGFEEDDYVRSGNFGRVSMDRMLAHYRAVRASSVALLDTFGPDSWMRTGTANGQPISLRAQVCVLIGHERHHLEVIRERYLKASE